MDEKTEYVQTFVREAELHEIYARADLGLVWRHAGVDPHTWVGVTAIGEVFVRSPDGLPVTLQGRESIIEAIRSWARGICPQCGGRWAQAHPCGDPAYPPYFADDVAEIICAVIDITTQCLLAKPPGQAQEHMLYLLGIFTAQHADRLRAEARTAGLALELSPEPS